MAKRMVLARAMVALVAVFTIAVTPAQATFPGSNGKIAFDGPGGITTMNPDGSGQVAIRATGAEPAWAANGRKIAFIEGTAVSVMDASGANAYPVTTADDVHGRPAWSPDGSTLAYEYQTSYIALTDAGGGGSEVPISHPGDAQADRAPDWSPDGDLIVFDRFFNTASEASYSILMVMNADGSNEHELTTAAGFIDQDPSISPDGQTVVFQRRPTAAMGGGPDDLYTVPIGGGTPARLTNTPALREMNPVWSPDGTKIAFAGRDPSFNTNIYAINADGTGQQQLTTGGGGLPSWQVAVQRAPGFPRPKSAAVVRVPLVPAYQECTAPNNTHGSPLASGSCSPPDGVSDFATIGTPDVNGYPARSTGHVLLKTIGGDPSTARDEADVRIKLSLRDVRTLGDPSAGYPGSLALRVPLRLTDKHSGCCGEAGTVVDFSFGQVEAPCAPAGPGVGATCSLTTTAETIVPGAVPEGKRSLWELTGPVRVYDSGLDGDASTQADNTLLATQGIFVP